MSLVTQALRSLAEPGLPGEEAGELEEETGVRIDADQLTLYTVTNLPTISEVYVVFRGSVSDPAITCGPRSRSPRAA